MPSVDFALNPLIVIWETTRACQLACRHCRASAIRHRDPQELNFDEVTQFIIDPLTHMQYPLFVLTGGDPMERDDLVEIVRQARAKGLRPSITWPLVSMDRAQRFTIGFGALPACSCSRWKKLRFYGNSTFLCKLTPP